MEVYVLDSLFRVIACVDEFESFIWTERFSSSGDFELKLSSTYGYRSLFTAGTRLVQPNSTRVMTIETVQDATDDNDVDILTISGPSIEDVLNNRIAFNVNGDTTFHPGWALSGTAGDICREMFDVICRTASVNSEDAIPFLTTGTIYPTDTIEESTTTLHLVQTPKSLYDAIKELCDANELGFRLVRPNTGIGGALYFDIYAGIDCTSRQTDHNAVIFSADLDDLQKTSELTVVQNSKNVAYVYSPAGFMIVYGDGVSADISGFDRRILFVDGSSVTFDNPDITGALQQLGADALMGARASKLFDGEINQYSQFTYEVDYRLGDLVEVRNKDGERTYKRVTEQIFVDDANGERSYPTLTTDLFAGAEDWLSLSTDSTTWEDHDGDILTWSDYEGDLPTAPSEFIYAGLFTDDFLRFNDGNLGKPWYYQEDDYKSSIADALTGGFVYSNEGTGGAASVLLDLPYDDFEIEFDSYIATTMVVDFMGPVGMPYVTGETWWQFNINADGSAGFYSINAHTPTTIATVAAGHFTITAGVDAITHVKIRAKAGTTTLTIAGTAWSQSYTQVSGQRTIKILEAHTSDWWTNFSVKEV